jgi:hypothetical protein
VDTITCVKNISIGTSSPSYNSAIGSLFIANNTTLPTTSTNAGANLFAIGGKVVSFGNDYMIHNSSEITVRLKTTTTLPDYISNGTTITATANAQLPSIDGITAAIGDYIFVTNAGVYIVTSIGSANTPWQFTRATIANTPTKFQRGTKIVVTDGVTMGGSVWIHTTNSSSGTPFTFNDNLTFTELARENVNANNLGSGIGIFSSKENNNLQFNSIIPSSTILPSLNVNAISFDIISNSIDHNNLSNLRVGDVHTQYVLLSGRNGGQTIYGGSAPNDTLILQSNSNSVATGNVIISSPLQINANITSTSATQTITGGTSPTNGLTIYGTATSNGNLILQGNSDSSSTGCVKIVTTAQTTNSTNGALQVVGGIATNDNISVAKNIYIGQGTANYNSAQGIIHLDNATSDSTNSPTTGIHIKSIDDRFIIDGPANVNTISVRLKTTNPLPNVTSNGTTITSTINSRIPSIDNINPNIGDYIFVDDKSQIIPSSAYGIYKITNLGGNSSNWSMVRAPVANTSEKFANGLHITVLCGQIASGTTWVHTTNNSQFILNTTTPVFTSKTASLFAKNQASISSTAPANNFTTNVHLTLTTPILTPGYYKISWNAEISGSSTSSNPAYRILLDGETLTSLRTSIKLASTFYPIFGFDIVQFTEQTSHIISLGFNAGGSGSTVMKRSAICIERQ